MRVLAMTKLFPSAADPIAAPFNRLQLSALGRLCEVEVLATIPWFPGATRLARFTESARALNAPAEETIGGLKVRHPRTLYLPKLPTAAGPLYAASMLPVIRRYRGAVDVLLAPWAYPDGWAGVVLAKLLGVPAVVKVHGSDINRVAALRGPRALMRLVLPHAAAVVAVSQPLAQATAALGVARERIAVIPNGVDAAMFHPRDRGEARAALGRGGDEQLVIYVGYLKRTKGALDLIEAFAAVSARNPKARLVLIGDGEDRDAVAAAMARVNRAAGAAAIAAVGPVPHDQVPVWMAASDVLALPSWAEGTPGVVVEALACGRRVVTSDVGGIPDVVTSPLVGEMVAPRDIGALGEALTRSLTTPYDPSAVAAAAHRGSWSESAGLLYELLCDVTATR
jgi:glycosyltransferase involved in cell wall biosynthesis